MVLTLQKRRQQRQCQVLHHRALPVRQQRALHSRAPCTIARTTSSSTIAVLSPTAAEEHHALSVGAHVEGDHRQPLRRRLDMHQAKGLACAGYITEG
jgi:hypothetical protein